MANEITYDVNNPQVNVFLDRLYSGNDTNAQYVPSNKNQLVANDFQSILTPYAIFLIETVINTYNYRYGSNYNPTDFGIANIPNDQNSHCAYIIFPLLTTLNLIIRVYLQSSVSIHIDFNFIDTVEGPEYTST